MWSIQKCRLYLLGAEKFTVVTDHKPLIPIINGFSLDVIENPRLQRLKEKLAPYVFSLEWSKGKSHCIVDALSRAPVEEPEGDEDGETVDSHIRGVIVSAIQSGEIDVDPALELFRLAAKSDSSYVALKDALQNPRSLKPTYLHVLVLSPRFGMI